MDDKSTYIAYKETFLSLVHSLRMCDSTIEEAQLINMYLAKLNQNVFFNIYFHRIDKSGWHHPAQDVNRLDEAVALTDKMFNTFLDAERETKRAKTDTDGNNSSNKDKSGSNSNNNNSNVISNSKGSSQEENKSKEALQDAEEINVLKATAKPCFAFKNIGKCRFGDRCKYSHEK